MKRRLRKKLAYRVPVRISPRAPRTLECVLCAVTGLLAGLLVCHLLPLDTRYASTRRGACQAQWQSPAATAQREQLPKEIRNPGHAVG